MLCTAHTLWLNPVIRPVFVRSGECTTQMATNEKQRKIDLTNEKQRKAVSSKSIKVRLIIEHLPKLDCRPTGCAIGNVSKLFSLM